MALVFVKSVTVQCGHCQGEGRIELTGETRQTFDLIEKLHPAEATGASLGRSLGVSGPAMNNRLAKLEEYGLITSRRWGRERFYKVVKPKKKGGRK